MTHHACEEGRRPRAPRPMKLEDRLWRHIMPEPNSGCWLWTGSLLAGGYSHFSRGGNRTTQAHRVTYEIYKGEIPDGFVIDHLCRNRQCVNPDHLEAVTMRENVLRGESLASRRAKITHCPRGHAYDAKNTARDYKNRRYCRICVSERRREALTYCPSGHRYAETAYLDSIGRRSCGVCKPLARA